MRKFKELTKREKLLICAAVMTTCAAGYFGVKYIGDRKQIEKLADDTNTLTSAASEGLFDEALATVSRKIAYRKDREQYLLKQLALHPGESIQQLIPKRFENFNRAIDIIVIQNDIEDSSTIFKCMMNLAIL